MLATTAPRSIRRGSARGQGDLPPCRGRPRGAGARRSAANRAARPTPPAPRDRLLGGHRIRPLRGGTSGARRPGPRGTGRASRAAYIRHGEHRIERDRPGDPESLRGTCDRIRALGEGETGRVDPDKTVPLVALVPRPQIGQNADAVELGEVEEMHQRGAGRDQPLDRFHRPPDPVEGLGHRRHGDVRARGSHCAAGYAQHRFGVPWQRRGPVSGTVWDRIEESRARYNVLEHRST